MTYPVISLLSLLLVPLWLGLFITHSIRNRNELAAERIGVYVYFVSFLVGSMILAYLQHQFGWRIN